jgi:IS30 family transposase
MGKRAEREYQWTPETIFSKKDGSQQDSKQKVEHVQHLLNNRSRKLLNFLAPDEVFNHMSYKTNCCTS